MSLVRCTKTKKVQETDFCRRNQEKGKHTETSTSNSVVSRMRASLYKWDSRAMSEVQIFRIPSVFWQPSGSIL